MIHYSEMIDVAMRGVVRDVLKNVQKRGLPGEHHFFLTFRTDHPGTRISDTLKNRYPREMTIVLQHQFWDFRVEEDRFFATLSFGGVPEKLEIPFVALTGFADPSVKFGLQLQQPEPLLPEQVASIHSEEFVTSGTGGAVQPHTASSADDADGAEIISLDAFRKK